MRFTIVGAGAIGGITGAHLIRAGHEVTFVDTANDHLLAIRDRGLQLEGLADIRAVPKAALLPSEVCAPLGMLICAVKTLHTISAIEPLAPLLAKNEYALSMQNGLAYEDVAGLVGRERTLVACFNFGGHYESPGRVVFGTRGGFHVGELDGQISERLRALAAALGTVQECEASSNVLGCLWSKMAMASVFFATALVDADVAEILGHERFVPVLSDLVAETVAAADAIGVRLLELHGFDPNAFRPGPRSDEAVRRSLDAIAGSFNPLQQRTGIWIDLAVRKRKTEAEPQLGRLVMLAANHGVAMPRNRAVLELILEMEKGRRGFSYGNLEEVERHALEVSAGPG